MRGPRGAPAALSAPFLVVLLLGACAGDGGTEGTPSTEVTQSGDTTIIVPALDGPTGRLVSDLIIGADESNPDALFGRIADAAFGPDGSIWVVDSQASQVSRFRSDGAFDGLLTRGGDGPGEVRSPRMVAVGSDGSVAVASDAEIEWFSPSGTPLSTTRTSDLVHPFRFDPSGRLIVHHGPAAPPATATWRITTPEVGPRAVRAIEVVVARRVTQHWIEVLESDGSRRDSIAGPVGLDDLACPLVPDAGGGRLCIFVAYAPTTWFDWLPDGRRIDVRTETYQLDISPRSGGAVSLRPPRAPELLENGIADIVAGSWNTTDEEALNALFSRREHKPAVSRIVPSRDGRIWVRLHAPSERGTDSDGGDVWVETESRFDIFTPDGEHVGYVTGPPDLTLRDARGDTVLTTRAGRFGVPIVERFVVEWQSTVGR